MSRTLPWPGTEPGYATTNINLAATYSYDSEGRTTNETYPTDHNGPTADVSYTFDQTGRLNGMTHNIASQTIVSSVAYGSANEIAAINGGSYYGAFAGESRSYNSLRQLTQISTPDRS